MSSIVFEHATAQNLYDNANSHAFGCTTTTNGIRDFIIPYVKAVIQDKDAYSELLSKWSSFKTVDQHLKTERSSFEKLDFETSMCTSLWFYIYH